jgi:hypothetical protein
MDFGADTGISESQVGRLAIFSITPALKMD